MGNSWGRGKWAGTPSWSSEHVRKGPRRSSPLRSLCDILCLELGVGWGQHIRWTQTCCKTPGLWPYRCHRHKNQSKAEEHSRLRRLESHAGTPLGAGSTGWRRGVRVGSFPAGEGKERVPHPGLRLFRNCYCFKNKLMVFDFLKKGFTWNKLLEAVRTVLLGFAPST